MKSPRFNQDGFIAGAEGLYFGVFIFVFGTMIVMNAWFVVDTKFVTAGAAREAARVYAEAINPATAGDQAVAAAQQVMSAHGRDSKALQINVASDGYRRCSAFTVTATYPVQLSFIPFVGGRSAFTVSSSYDENIDAYRAGLPGEADC